jgi:hypothetical protein
MIRNTRIHYKSGIKRTAAFCISRKGFSNRSKLGLATDPNMACFIVFLGVSKKQQLLLFHENPKHDEERTTGEQGNIDFYHEDESPKGWWLIVVVVV